MSQFHLPIPETLQNWLVLISFYFVLRTSVVSLDLPPGAVNAPGLQNTILIRYHNVFIPMRYM